MRIPVPENRKIFVRFHKDICKMIEEYADRKGKKKATITSEILSQYAKTPFPLSPHASIYYMKKGRSTEVVKGNAMNITMKKVLDNAIRIHADENGIGENNFRAAIIYSYIQNEKERETE